MGIAQGAPVSPVSPSLPCSRDGMGQLLHSHYMDKAVFVHVKCVLPNVVLPLNDPGNVSPA